MIVFDGDRLSLKSRVMLLALAVGAAGSWAVQRTAVAVSTRHFRLDSAAELAKGELDGVAVHSDGKVTLGVQTIRTPLPDDDHVAYSMARRADGSVFVGTGHDGKVFLWNKDKVELFAETKELLVASLAFGPDGTLYAGTLPHGRIYAIARDKSVRRVIELEKSEHVWDLLWDSRRKRLWAATGPEGRLFEVDPKRKKAILRYDAKASHIMSLARLGDDVYAGTSDAALLLRVNANNKVEVVYDFPGNEVTAIASGGDRLAVVANDFPKPPTVANTAKRAKAGRRTPRPKPGKGRVWQVWPDGNAEQLYADDKEHFTSVAFGPDGAAFVGTGVEGRIVRLEAGGMHAVWLDVDERQVLAMDFASKPPIFSTGDGAAIYRVSPGNRGKAVWTSSVLDAGFPSRWGELVWRGKGNFGFETRSGNTEKPNEAWSSWSTTLQRAGPIRSPAARYLQIRASFRREPDPLLYAVTAYYLPRNQRARVFAISASAVTKKAKDDGKQDEPPKPTPKLKISWKVKNRDKDSLRFRLRFRAESQAQWRSILRETTKLTAPTYVWDTSSIPDGRYLIEVDASDEHANPSDFALHSQAISEPILIDNHAPRVDALRVQGRKVIGSVTDSMGPIAQLEYAVNGGEWLPLFPVDDLLDTARERFAIDLSRLERGSHIIAVRAKDGAGNIGSRETTVRMP